MVTIGGSRRSAIIAKTDPDRNQLRHRGSRNSGECRDQNRENGSAGGDDQAVDEAGEKVAPTAQSATVLDRGPPAGRRPDREDVALRRKRRDDDECDRAEALKGTRMTAAARARPPTRGRTARSGAGSRRGAVAGKPVDVRSLGTGEHLPVEPPQAEQARRSEVTTMIQPVAAAAQIVVPETLRDRDRRRRPRSTAPVRPA